MIDGETHSINAPARRRSEARREYWGFLAAVPFRLPPNPAVLMLGLGGGTALHLLSEDLAPSEIVVVEADPEIVRVAREYFDIDALGGVTIRTGDALGTMRGLIGEGRTFDLLIDDVYFTTTSASGPGDGGLFDAVRRLVRRGGTAVFNRPLDGRRPHPEHEAFAAELRSLGHEAILVRVRRRWWNDIIYCRISEGHGTQG